MKTSVKKFAVMLTCLLCLIIGLLTFAACNNSEQFTLTLDAGSGTLNQTTIQVAKDVSIMDIVGDIVPKADGLIFDEWLLNGSPIKADDKMTKNISLTASYKTLYRIEVYYQNADKSNYVQDDAKTVIGYGKVGERVSPAVADIGGYVLNKELSSDASKTLAAGENLFKYFYARADRTITYTALLEDNEESVIADAYNGASVTIEDCTFERPGYKFIGWSDDVGLGADERFAVGQNITVTENVQLYAQWGIEYSEAYKSGDSVVIAEFADEKGEYKAVFTASNGEKSIGVYDSQTEFFVVDGKKGKIDEQSGQFLYDATGVYLGYSLLGGASDEKYGIITLDALT